MATATPLKKDNVAKALSPRLDAGEGLLRLTPTWVPRSFLHPGKRIKLAPGDWYAYGAHRGGIDERWFASTTEAANEGRAPDEGLSYVRASRASGSLLRDAVAEAGAAADRQGDVRQVQALAGLLEVLRQHGPDPASHAPELRSTPRWPARRASPRATTSRRSCNNVDNNFAYTFMGLEPGTTKAAASASAWRTGTRATTASSTSRRRIA